jgi:hypothetical protein
MDVSEQAAERYLQTHSLRAERFSKEEIRRGKTPDFRVFKAEDLAFYCEAKHLQRDRWLDEHLRKAQPGELIGGLRDSDPSFSRLTGHIHQAVKQFEAVNPDHDYPNVLFFTNSDKTIKPDVMREVVTGNFSGKSGMVDPIFKKYSEGRIKKEICKIDLMMWIDDSTSRKPTTIFHRFRQPL